jgi:hypothetical protein
MTDSDGEEATYEHVMNIVLAESNGGPFDDAAVVAGMTCGALDQELTMASTIHTLPHERYLDAPLLQQADLIAMKHGYVMRVGELDEPSGYHHVTFDWA